MKTKIICGLITIIGITNISSLAYGQNPQSPNILFNPTGYKLGPGDVVKIGVFGEPETLVTVKISREGTVRLRYIDGEVPIMGLTPKAAEEFISQQYIKERIYRKAQVHVSITEYTEQHIMFIGKFVKAGPFTFPPEVEAMDIVEVITRNGGFQDIAKTTEVKITRMVHDKRGSGVKETYTVDVKARMESGAQHDPFLIYPGDTLHVGEKLF